jgi:2-oxoglutarate dehydrogenase complex dehydrogenase (E1) component-like enzyme
MAQAFTYNEIYATFGADVTEDETGTFIEEVDLIEVEMFNRIWTKKELYERFGKEGADALITLIEDTIDHDEWEESRE